MQEGAALVARAVVHGRWKHSGDPCAIHKSLLADQVLDAVLHRAGLGAREHTLLLDSTMEVQPSMLTHT